MEQSVDLDGEEKGGYVVNSRLPFWLTLISFVATILIILGGGEAIRYLAFINPLAVMSVAMLGAFFGVIGMVVGALLSALVVYLIVYQVVKVYLYRRGMDIVFLLLLGGFYLYAWGRHLYEFFIT